VLAFLSSLEVVFETKTEGGYYINNEQPRHVINSLTFFYPILHRSSFSLYLACELAEEYSSIVRRYLHRGTIGIGLFYIILAIDGLPFNKCAFGLVTYISYLPLLATFPFVQPISFATIWALVVTLLNHISWFNYFISDEYRKYLRVEYEQGSSTSLISGSPAMKVMGFLFVFVWVVPLGYFISLTSIEESLPFAHGGIGSNSQGQKKGKGLFKSFVDELLEKKNQFFPKKNTDPYKQYQ
jgi:hypothetical protein